MIILNRGQRHQVYALFNFLTFLFYSIVEPDSIIPSTQNIIIRISM